MPRRLITLLAATALTLLVTLGLASPASAATLAQKLSVMWSFTQATAASESGWSGLAEQ